MRQPPEIDHERERLDSARDLSDPPRPIYPLKPSQILSSGFCFAIMLARELRSPACG